MDTKDWLKRNFIPLLTLLLAIAITVGILYFYENYPGFVGQLRRYGYPGAFLISLTFNATLILPVGNILILSVLGAVLPSAILVGVVGGAGAAVGEITGYMAGYSGRGLAERSRMYERVEGWMERWGTLTILIMSLVPLIFDLAGIAAGVLRFPFWKFFLLCLLGRTVFSMGVALTGAWGWGVMSTTFSTISMGMVPVAIVSMAALATGALLVIVLAVESWVWKRGW